MRKNFTMTQAQYDKIIEACRPVPMIMLQCGNPPSQQERANAAWEALGREMGFDGRSVAPADSDNRLKFTAEART